MRLAKLTPDQLSTAQQQLYNDIAAGPRAAGKQHFALVDDAGALVGPFGVMVHQPALGKPLQELGTAIRYRTGISDRVREIAILAVAAATDSEFERYAHERVGRAVGLTEQELTDLANLSFIPSNPAEAKAYSLCQRLLDDCPAMTDAEYAELDEILGQSAVMELVVLVGYYRTLAQLLHVFGVGAPEDPASPEQP